MVVRQFVHLFAEHLTIRVAEHSGSRLVEEDGAAQAVQKRRRHRRSR